jgi:hypothetical protein
MRLASRSATESASSANAGSKVFNGKGASCCALDLADSRNDDREEGRRGVVGRDARDFEFERLMSESPVSIEAEAVAASGDICSAMPVKE